MFGVAIGTLRLRASAAPFTLLGKPPPPLRGRVGKGGIFSRVLFGFFAKT